jgi:hypothetical protein
MTDSIMEPKCGTAARRPKDLTISEMIHNNREAGSPYMTGDLRACLVERQMARHGLTEEQALAEILAFSR